MAGIVLYESMKFINKNDIIFKNKKLNHRKHTEGTVLFPCRDARSPWPLGFAVFKLFLDDMLDETDLPDSKLSAMDKQHTEI